MAISHFLLLTDLQAQAAPEPRTITVGESEYEKAERAERRRKKAEAKRREAEERAKKRTIRNAGSRTVGYRNNDSRSDKSYITFEATAYVAFCDTGCSGVTKTGIDVSNTTTHAGRTVVAVDPTVIPLGSAVEVRLADGRVIEGTAQDTGGAIRGNRIDILMGSEGQARQFGRQSVKIRILK